VARVVANKTLPPKMKRFVENMRARRTAESLSPAFVVTAPTRAAQRRRSPGLSPIADGAVRLLSQEAVDVLYELLDQFIVAMDTRMPGTTWVIAKGTLLGAARSGGVQPFESDVDTAVFHDVESWPEKYLGPMKTFFEKRGLRFEQTYTHVFTLTPALGPRSKAASQADRYKDAYEEAIRRCVGEDLPTILKTAAKIHKAKTPPPRRGCLQLDVHVCPISSNRLVRMGQDQAAKGTPWSDIAPVQTWEFGPLQVPAPRHGVQLFSKAHGTQWRSERICYDPVTRTRVPVPSSVPGRLLPSSAFVQRSAGASPSSRSSSSDHL